MHPKTILHITGMGGAKYGGLENYFVQLTRLCNQHRYKTVFQYESLPEVTAYLNDLKDLHAKLLVRPVNTNPLQALFTLVRLLGTVRPEIIHTHFVNRYALLLTPLVARLFGVRKCISSVHLVPCKLWPAAYNRYDRILPVSNLVRDALIQGGVAANRLTTHYLGLFGEHTPSGQKKGRLREQYAIPEQAVVLACIAFDHEVKGVDVLFKALARIVRQDKQKNLHLVVVGIDPEQSQLPGLADELGISRLVHWPGIRDQAWRILNVADIYVQPSRSEGLPFAVMEAMAMKLPVVCTRTGSIEAVVDRVTGIVAEPDDPGSLATAIERLLAMAGQWPQMGEAGYRRFRELFYGPESVKKMMSHYII
ncbi:MAG: glycosyltransferase family 4 protein [Desulfobacterales bacterium]|nr:glycosyltransferase family 4 protein [Desulfobacterales bacterium]